MVHLQSNCRATHSTSAAEANYGALRRRTRVAQTVPINWTVAKADRVPGTDALPLSLSTWQVALNKSL
jgi:hypothetical protein